jgi:hypothetical protein
VAARAHVVDDDVGAGRHAEGQQAQQLERPARRVARGAAAASSAGGLRARVAGPAEVP